MVQTSGKGRWQRPGKAPEQWARLAIPLSRNLGRSSSNGKLPDVILSPAWREVSLLVFPGEGFSEHRACRLVSNREGSPAGLECDSHTGNLHSRELYFEKISSQDALKLLFVAWAWCSATAFLFAGGVGRGRAPG